MSDDHTSIEDLILASEGEVAEGSAQDKFLRKQEELAKKNLERVTQAKARKLGLPYIHLVGFPISPEAIKLISEEEARRLRAVCFFYDGKSIRVGTVEPTEEVIDKLEELAKEYHAEGKLYLISETSLNSALYYYRSLPKIREVIRGVKISEKDLAKYSGSFTNFKILQEKINEVSTTEIVTMLIASAIQMNASDIHIEAEEDGVKVRFRIDGVLHDAAVIERKKWKKIISRMKLLARVKINITDKPQDGRFTIYLTNDRIDVRSSFLPTAFGESVVMRLLRSSSVGLAFEDLGLSERDYKILEREIRKPNGLILTTGPTGSGKTTTLYAILNKINTPDTKIITLEDPIEYQLKGISQSQVDASRGYTFAKGLRSILRQDPDVVMVGEIRDLETAEIAIQASLTGHLVLSTLHTNDASGVIPRLLDMGVKPFFLTPAINALIGQRLVRRLCPYCKVEHKLSEEEEAQVNKILAVLSPKAGVEVPKTLPTFYKAGKGCDYCNGLGYKGRIGIYEILTMNNKIKELVSKNTPAFKILEQAIENGMVTMLQDGVLKAMDGITSLEEVYRVIGKFEYIDALYDIVISQTLRHGISLDKTVKELGEKIAQDLSSGAKVLAQTSPGDIFRVIMAAAVKVNAGDVHIEPAEKNVKIRFRVEGIMHEVAEIPSEHYLPLLSQVKLASNFPTNVKKASWDGRFSVMDGDNKIDCRVSIISGGYGETVVIRLLNQQATALKMETLGMESYALEPVKKVMKKTKGMIITTGPTGSGKTTTLYSILRAINKPDIKIITVEDPIEYHMDGVLQTQVDPEKGYTFAVALRSLLRQNPNVIMIGEIRDEETAKIGVESALTGHLVLSTIHANSAANAVARLVGLGVDKQLLASSLECSIGQRLVRQICPHCKQEVKVSQADLKRVEDILAPLKNNKNISLPPKSEWHFYKGEGCSYCSNIGYKGRLGIFEVIILDNEIRKLIQQPTVTDTDIEQAAQAQGTVLMLQDGILKALAGKTTLDEVFRVAE